MRILYLTESIKWSGGAHQTLLMARALLERGHNLTLACQPGSDIAERARSLGVPTERVRMRQDYDLPAAFRIARLLTRLRIDLLHAQHSTAHALGLMAAWWAKTPAFVVTRRVIFPLKTNPFSLLKYRSSRIDGYIAVAPAVKDTLVRAGIARERVEVIPSVVDGPVASAEEGRALRRDLGIPESSPLVGTVANYAVFKGHDVLVASMKDVVKRIPEAKLLLVGRDTETLQPVVKQAGLSGAVFLAGFRSDIPRVLAALDVFVLPSLQEAAAGAIREALFAGRPCIGSRTGGIPEAIRDQETGLLVSPGDAPALAEALIRLLTNPEEAARMAARGQAWVREQFSLARAADQLEAFYQRVGAAKR